jgi:phosphoesterase RecJ-like protein
MQHNKGNQPKTNQPGGNQLEGNQLEGDLKTAFQLVQEALRRYQSFVLTTHQGPDGDGLGAEAALAEALTQMGKEVRVINNDPVPGHNRFLHGSEAFQTYQESQHQDLLAGSDAVILLDAARPERTGRLADVLTYHPGTTVSFDHHLDGGWARLDLIDARACATTELVHDLIQGLPVRLTRTIAEALYAGIAADTLVFRTAHTTPEVHRRAAQLMEAGASTELLEDLKIYGRFPS